MHDRLSLLSVVTLTALVSFGYFALFYSNRYLVFPRYPLFEMDLDDDTSPAVIIKRKKSKANRPGSVLRNADSPEVSRASTPVQATEAIADEDESAGNVVFKRQSSKRTPGGRTASVATSEAKPKSKLSFGLPKEVSWEACSSCQDC